MITSVTIKNFKSFKLLSLNLEPLNIFTGLNGSGKSSLFQALLLLKQSYNSEGRLRSGLIVGDGDILNLGKGKDILFQYSNSDEQIKFDIECGDITLNWTFKYEINSKILPSVTVSDEHVLKCNLFTNKFQYLNTEHVSPKTTHNRNENFIQENNIGIQGEFAVHYLALFGIEKKITNPKLLHPKGQTNSLLHQVDAWLSEISPGAKLVIEEIKGIDLIKLAVRFEDKNGYSDDYQPINVGFGITYVLPVILALLKAEPEDILLIENPESHLHPRGQSEMGKLIAMVAASGVQLFVETHSDHLINGIRVAVKQKIINHTNAKIFFFERFASENETQSISYEISIDSAGELSLYPKFFLDEWEEQLIKLI